MIERPTTNEEILPINADLSVHYSVFKDGFIFRRPAGSWPHWRKLPFEVPASNPWLYENHTDGVAFDCCEHVSVAVTGDATYTLETAAGAKDYLWERGVHNVANGMGYLPSGEFTRTFRNGFTLCCIVQPFNGRDTETRYSFEVLLGPQTLLRDPLAIHFCTGAREKETSFDHQAGDVVVMADNDLAIVIYVEG